MVINWSKLRFGQARLLVYIGIFGHNASSSLFFMENFLGSIHSADNVDMSDSDSYEVLQFGGLGSNSVEESEVMDDGPISISIDLSPCSLDADELYSRELAIVRYLAWLVRRAVFKNFLFIL